MGVNITNTLNTLDNWETKIKQNKVTNFASTGFSKVKDAPSVQLLEFLISLISKT